MIYHPHGPLKSHNHSNVGMPSVDKSELGRRKLQLLAVALCFSSLIISKILRKSENEKDQMERRQQKGYFRVMLIDSRRSGYIK